MITRFFMLKFQLSVTKTLALAIIQRILILWDTKANKTSFLKYI
jgi:hypothetical protein